MGTQAGPFRHPFKAMGSPCEIQLYAADAQQARAFADLAIADVERLEARYSRYRADSLLSKINRVAAGGGSIEVDEETAGLLQYADTCHRESAGRFDITSGLLREVWRFDRGTLPDPARIEALLQRIGWHRVRWEPPRLHFPPGMELDFGGVVKEYAADRAAALCSEAGVRHGVVNLGGDIRIVGPRPDGQPWRVGVQDPRRAGAAAAIALHAGGVATSGDYERCIRVDGKRFGHVLNPKTGWPVQHLASVTVVGELCVVAGSASTIAMLKEAAGPQWLASLGLPHLWIDVDGNAGGPLAPGAAAAQPGAD
jgi:thiamine biosynthesis lipoprotein